MTSSVCSEAPLNRLCATTVQSSVYMSVRVHVCSLHARSSRSCLNVFDETRMHLLPALNQNPGEMTFMHGGTTGVSELFLIQKKKKNTEMSVILVLT